MYERFTDEARRVMQLSNTEAQGLHHEHIGTEHILLALVEGDGSACVLLRMLGVEPKSLAVKIYAVLRQGSETVSMAHLHLTSRAKKVLEYTNEEARELKCDFISTHHLLLGIIREEQGVAAQVLNEAGVTLEKAREMIVLLPPAAWTDLHKELIAFVRELGLSVSMESLLAAVKTARRDYAVIASLRDALGNSIVW